MSKAVIEASERLCSSLVDMGLDFHWEADNRPNRPSRYIYIRKPSIKIRVSNHKSDRVEKEKKNSRTAVIDVGTSGSGVTVDEALRQVAEMVNA